MMDVMDMLFDVAIFAMVVTTAYILYTALRKWLKERLR